MKSLSSSLTSPVVSLVMLQGPQPRTSQRNRSSLSPKQELGPWRNYSTAMFTACWKMSFSCLICICWRHCSHRKPEHWLLSTGRACVRIRAMDVPHASYLTMNSGNFVKQKLKFEPPFYNFHSTFQKHLSWDRNHEVTYNLCNCLFE